MKAEFVNISGKGLCILISDLDLANIPAQIMENYTDKIQFSVFSNVMEIADQMRHRRKINAIKEVRSQTGWGLKEAKEFIDKHYNNIDGFIRKYTFQEFLESDEMEI